MTSQDLADRYGARTPRWVRLVAVLAGVPVVVVIAAMLGWAALDQGSPAAHSEVVSFQVVDEHTVTASVAVDIDPGAEDVECVLRAFAEDHATVGELTFSPDPGTSRRLEVSVRTERRATTVENVGCTAEGQDRPR